MDSYSQEEASKTKPRLRESSGLGQIGATISFYKPKQMVVQSILFGCGWFNCATPKSAVRGFKPPSEIDDEREQQYPGEDYGD